MRLPLFRLQGKRRRRLEAARLAQAGPEAEQLVAEKLPGLPQGPREQEDQGLGREQGLPERQGGN